MTPELYASLSLATPELIVAIGAIVLLLIGVYSRGNPSTLVTSLVVLVLTAAAGWIVLFTPDGHAFNNAFVSDPFARFMQVVTLIGSAVTLVMSVGFARSQKFDTFEYPVLVMLSTLGMMLMATANNLIALYICFELQSLALYIVAAINRDNLRSSEAGLKYFVLGALASGMMLYGISLVYGYTGSIEYAAIRDAVSAERQVGVLFGMVFILAGLVFKISAAPFHMWTPDVYEGAPTPVTAFFAVAPKVATFALILRLVMTPFEPVAADWQQVIVFVSIASMAIGSFAAIGQRNFKRLMAYSSIGHMGFALVGLSANSQEGVRGVVVYMLIYVAMTLGTFAFIIAMRRKDVGQVEKIDDLAGLSNTNPVMATMLTILLFSLAGIPPLAGFWAKWYVFLAAINAGLYALAIIGVLTSVVAAFYYLRIIKIMWFDEPAGGFVPMSGELRVVLGLSGAFVLFYVLIGGPIGSLAQAAAKSFF